MSLLQLRDSDLTTLGGLCNILSQMKGQEGSDKVIQELAEISVNPAPSNLPDLVTRVLKRNQVEFVQT